MRVNGFFLILAILLLPVSGFASPTHQLNVGSYSGNGFSASSLHSADGCINNGYYMCGTTNHSGVTGTLDMVWDAGSSAYTSIIGNLFATDGTQIDITGGTLYSSLTGGSWGNLITNYGTFNFDDLSGFYNGAANNYMDDSYTLWGQTSNYITTTLTTIGELVCAQWLFGNCVRWDPVTTTTTVQVLADDQWGLDLYGNVSEIEDSVSVPEPTSMGLMALCLVGVAASCRKKKLS